MAVRAHTHDTPALVPASAATHFKLLAYGGKWDVEARHVLVNT